VLLSRPPLCLTRRRNTVRLACFRHAASVYPEPGSNSPSELSGAIHPLQDTMASDDLNRSSRSPPLFDSQRAPRDSTQPPSRQSPLEQQGAITPDLPLYRFREREVKGGPGTGRLSHAVAHAVSLALGRFTTVFGKGTGGTTPLEPPGPPLDRVSRGQSAVGSGATSSVARPRSGPDSVKIMSTRRQRSVTAGCPPRAADWRR
jgi:hypothetical protein